MGICVSDYYGLRHVVGCSNFFSFVVNSKKVIEPLKNMTEFNWNQTVDSLFAVNCSEILSFVVAMKKYSYFQYTTVRKI